MSINESPSSASFNPFGHFALGIASEVFSAIVTQPLDTLKTYRMRKMVRPRIHRLWDGTMANCLGASVQGGFPFLINGLLVHHWANGKQLSTAMQLTAAAATGFIASIITTPFERLAKLQQTRNYSITNAFQLATKNGYGGLYKTFLPVVWREMIVFGSFFGARNIVARHLNTLLPETQTCTYIAGATIGALSGILSTPIDKITVWMATDLTGKYTGIFSTARVIIQQEGYAGLYRGAGLRASYLALYMLCMGLVEKKLNPYLGDERHFE